MEAFESLFAVYESWCYAVMAYGQQYPGWMAVWIGAVPTVAALVIERVIRIFRKS